MSTECMFVRDLLNNAKRAIPQNDIDKARCQYKGNVWCETCAERFGGYGTRRD